MVLHLSCGALGPSEATPCFSGDIQLWGAEASCIPCAEHSTDTGQTPLDLLLWHPLNFSVSCCRETFHKKWLRNSQRKFTSTEASLHHPFLVKPLPRDVTQAGTRLPHAESVEYPASNHTDPKPFHVPEGATTPSTGSTKLGKQSSLVDSTTTARDTSLVWLQEQEAMATPPLPLCAL